MNIIKSFVHLVETGKRMTLESQNSLGLINGDFTLKNASIVVQKKVTLVLDQY